MGVWLGEDARKSFLSFMHAQAVTVCRVCECNKRDHQRRVFTYTLPSTKQNPSRRNGLQRRPRRLLLDQTCRCERGAGPVGPARPSDEPLLLHPTGKFSIFCLFVCLFSFIYLSIYPFIHLFV
jgi:hypothetical protein